MLTQLINGKIFTPNGWLEKGSVLIRDNKVLEVTNCDLGLVGANIIDVKGMYIVPGFVCMHAHGAGGHDFTEGTEEAFRTAVKAHQRHGATCIFPTMSASSFDEIRQGTATCEKLMAEEDTPIMGLHLEGPYLNPSRASDLYGEKLCEVRPEDYKSVVESTNCIKRWDASPELPGALDFARYMRTKGILTAMSHTEVEFLAAKEAFEAGFTHTAHFYNGMPGFHKCREYKYEGTVESVYLLDDMTIELIADGRHLPDTILRLAYKLKGVDKTCLVSDSMRFAGGEGVAINDPDIFVEDGVCKSRKNHHLAGSIATMDRVVRNTVKAGIPFEDVIRMVTETPAKLMGVFDRKGSLEKGKDADIVVLDSKLEVRAVCSMGKVVEGTDTIG